MEGLVKPQRRVSVLIDGKLFQNFVRRAKNLGHNRSALVRMFISDYLKATEAAPLGFPKNETNRTASK